MLTNLKFLEICGLDVILRKLLSSSPENDGIDNNEDFLSSDFCLMLTSPLLAKLTIRSVKASLTSSSSSSKSAFCSRG